MKPLVFLAAGAAALCACRAHTVKIRDCRAVPAAADARGDHVRVRYLGTGGYLVALYEGKPAEGARPLAAVLFGPQYTNPGLVELGGDHEIRTDTALVDGLLPPEAKSASAIVVGHSHYDHVMDVPYIARRHATDARIFGSRTMAHLLHAYADLRHRIVTVDGYAETGQPVPVEPRMRLYAIRSHHADQYRLWLPGTRIPFHLWRGTLSEDRVTPPRSGSEWAEGEVYAYVLDFLDESGRPIFRTYYQDTGSGPGKGYVPEGAWDGKAIDVALVCAAGEFRGLDHPKGIVANTRPRFVVVGHWEDFFVSQRTYCTEKAVRAVLPSSAFWRRTPTRRFVRKAEAALRKIDRDRKVYLPCPTASYYDFPVGGAAPSAEIAVRYPCAALP